MGGKYDWSTCAWSNVSKVTLVYKAINEGNRSTGICPLQGNDVLRWLQWIKQYGQGLLYDNC